MSSYSTFPWKRVAFLCPLLPAVGDDCTHDTISLWWKMSVSDPLCFSGQHISQRPSMCLVSPFSQAQTYHGNILARAGVSLKRTACEGIYDIYRPLWDSVTLYLQHKCSCTACIWEISAFHVDESQGFHFSPNRSYIFLPNHRFSQQKKLKFSDAESCTILMVQTKI